MELHKGLAENTVGLILARFVTPALIAVSLWLGNQYITRLDTTIGLVQVSIEKINDSLSVQSRQIAAIEASREATTKSRDGDFADVMRQMGGLQMRLDQTVNQIATISAKVEVLLNQGPNQRADP